MIRLSTYRTVLGRSLRVAGGSCALLLLSQAQSARAQSCTLSGDVAQVSLTAGGVQNLFLTRGLGAAGDGWLMLGSLSGTAPADPYLASAGLHLAWDRYTWATWHGRSPLLQGGIQGFPGGIVGLFDGAGLATLQVVVPPGAYPALVGRVMHHGFYMLDPLTLSPHCGSNTVSLAFVP